MSVIPYLSQGQGVEVDPLTGLPKMKKAAQSGISPALAAQMQAMNPSGVMAGFSGFPGGGGGSLNPVTVPGHTPDYKSLIQAALAPFQAQLGAEGVQDMNARNSQLIRSLGQFGEQFDLGQANQAFGADFVGESGLGELLPQANALAAQTTGAGVSFKARADKTHKDTVRQIRNSLASRGLLRSGELGHQLQEAQGQYDTGQYDARLQVQDFLSAVNQGYVQAQRARQTALGAASREEALRQAQLNPATGSQTYWPGQAGHPGEPGGAAAPQPGGAAAPAGSANVLGASPFIGAYNNPGLSAEQRAFEEQNRIRKLQAGLARQGF